MTIAFLALTAYLALTVPGVVLALRALPPIARRTEAGIKPWSCDICMCFWTTAFLALCVAWDERSYALLYAAGPAYTVALGILGFLERPMTFPPLPDAPAPAGIADALEPSEKK